VETPNRKIRSEDIWKGSKKSRY